MDKLAVASEDSESLGPSLVALVRGDLLNLGCTPGFRAALGSTVTSVTMTMMSEAELPFKDTSPVT